jgi:hypothetical protein
MATQATHKKIHVFVWNLHVLITQNDGHWFAQGAQVDYAAQGTSLEDVKKNFENGFAETIHEHLKVYGTPKYFLARKAHFDVFEELLKVKDKSEHTFSQKSLHIVGLPEVSVEYVLQKAA